MSLKSIIHPVIVVFLLATAYSAPASGAQPAQPAQELFSKGSTLANSGDYFQAASYLARAIDVDPRYMPAYVALSVVYINHRSYSLAIGTLNKALAIDSRNENACYLLAMLYEETGDVSNAIGTWEKYLTINPHGSRSDAAREHLRNLKGS